MEFFSIDLGNSIAKTTYWEDFDRALALGEKAKQANTLVGFAWYKMRANAVMRRADRKFNKLQ